MPLIPARILCAWFLVLSASLYGDILGELKIAALRVSFEQDSRSGTTGDGSFLLDTQVNRCGNYTIDPPPHDQSYFESQLIAVDRYYRTVSRNQFGIDLSASHVFPDNSQASYRLNNPMSYYHPYNQDDVTDIRLTELLRDALNNAFTNDSIDFSSYDLVVVFHAGIGQDFSLPFLDPTPEDIPSTYVDKDMLEAAFGVPYIQVGNSRVPNGILLPETQNHLLYDISETLFGSGTDPCDLQYGVTGTFALMIGFAMGLPPLWDTESGESGVGYFGLMDQGSNNGRGLVPAPPCAWARIHAGWEVPESVKPPQEIALPSRLVGNSVKIDLNDNEYFLLENAVNWLQDQASVDSLRYLEWTLTDTFPSYVNILLDDPEVERDSNGVVVRVPGYDVGLPASGIMIWHIDESVIEKGLSSYAVNNNREWRGVDLEEADGAQDIGYPSIFLFTDLSSGSVFDLWFKGNRENRDLYPDDQGESPVFGPYTFPDTRSYRGSGSYLRIKDFSLPGDTMTFRIENDLLATGYPDTAAHHLISVNLNDDQAPDLIGGKDTLWWEDGASGNRTMFFPTPVSRFQLAWQQAKNDDSVNESLLAYVGSRSDSTIVQTFIFDQEDKRFEMLWEHRLDVNEPELTRIDPNGGVQLIAGNSIVTVTEDSIRTETSDLTDLWPLEAQIIDMGSGQILSDLRVIRNRTGGLTIQPCSECDEPGMSGLQDVHFVHFGTVDLDLDGSPEILGVDTLGRVHVVNTNFIYEAGFPVSAGATSPVLSRQLFGDSRPELVVQVDSSDILVLGQTGREQYRLSSHRGSELRYLGTYQGNNVIVSDAAIWRFDESSDTGGNEWSHPHHDPSNERTFRFRSSMESPDSAHLIDVDNTYVYPNPARQGQTRIRITVGTADKITLKIYDIAGYHVREFKIDNPVQGEIQEFIWDLNDVESGVYFGIVAATRGTRSESKLLKIGVIH